MIKFYWTALDLAGNVIPGATVRVKSFLTGSNAPIYEDDGVTPKTNPMTADSVGRVSFKIDAGKYDIVTAYGSFSNTETEVTFQEDAHVAYLVNDEGSAFVFGELGYVSGDGLVKKAKSDGTETEASAEVICLETTLADGSTGRFRTAGLIQLSGTPGALGFLADDGTVTETVPSSGAGDTFSTLVGRFVSSTMFNFKPLVPMGLV